jgi:hypothetical protein
MDTQSQLRDLQTRQRALASKKDLLIREAGQEEQKLKECMNKLRDLGIKDPESLSADDMKDKASKLEEKLSEMLENIVTEIEKGETLLRQYEAQ